MNSRKFFALAFSFITLFISANEVEDTLYMSELEVVAPKETTPYSGQPLSVSTINVNTIRNQQIRSLKDVSNLVPNFFMPDYGSRLTSAIYIRGIGSRINTPAVGLYVDDVPYNDKSAFDFNLCDIVRMDVLRGPQGTLYGRNTMGGLIKVYTRSPLNYEGTNLTIGYGSGDHHRRASLTHYHRPSNEFAFSAGGYYEGSEGFFQNTYTKKKVDAMESGGGRMRAIWLPTKLWKLDANVNYDYSKQGGYPYFYEGELDESKEENKMYIGSIAHNRESTYRRSMLNASLNAQYEAPKFTINSVTGYQHLSDRMFLDQDFLPADIYTLTQKQRLHTLNEEITLKSARANRWQWVSGANFMYQGLRTNGPVDFMKEGVDWLGETINQNMSMGPMSIRFNDEVLRMGGTFETPVFNAALFHQSTVKLVERLLLTMGLRLDYEHNSMDYNAPANVNFSMVSRMNPNALISYNAYPSFNGRLKNDFWLLQPKVALKYDFNSNNSIYATVSRGTRSGGYNVQMFSDLLQTELRRSMMQGIADRPEDMKKLMSEMGMPPMMLDQMVGQILGIIQQYTPESPDVKAATVYKPEYSWNYEVGTRLSTSDYRFQADAALFLIDTRDQQIARFSEKGLGRMMVNAGRSRSHGAELTLRAQPNPNLSFMANYGYCHSEFRKYHDGQTDYTGNYVPFAPRHTVNADASYTFFFDNPYLHNLQIGATYSGAGKIYWTESNSASQNYYNLLSARVSLTTEWAQIEFWGKNLTKTRYNTFYFESMGRGFSQHGKPLHVGVDLRFKF